MYKKIYKDDKKKTLSMFLCFSNFNGECKDVKLKFRIVYKRYLNFRTL